MLHSFAVDLEAIYSEPVQPVVDGRYHRRCWGGEGGEGCAELDVVGFIEEGGEGAE